jgi:hypothetical protein
MEISNISDFYKGWFIGNFEPSLHKNKEFEVGIKSFTKGEIEPLHYQKLAHEITIVISGKVRIANVILTKDQILEIFPFEKADFECLENAVLVCIKFPSEPEDKILVQ